MENKIVNSITWSRELPTKPGFYLFKPDQITQDNYPPVNLVVISEDGDLLVADSDSWHTWYVLENLDIDHTGSWSPRLQFTSELS